MIVRNHHHHHQCQLRSLYACELFQAITDRWFQAIIDRWHHQRHHNHHHQHHHHHHHHQCQHQHHVLVMFKRWFALSVINTSFVSCLALAICNGVPFVATAHDWRLAFRPATCTADGWFRVAAFEPAQERDHFCHRAPGESRWCHTCHVVPLFVGADQ